MASKRHKLVVEVTDMMGLNSTEDMTHTIRDALKSGLDYYNGDRYTNVKVK